MIADSSQSQESTLTESEAPKSSISLSKKVRGTTRDIAAIVAVVLSIAGYHKSDSTETQVSENMQNIADVAWTVSVLANRNSKWDDVFKAKETLQRIHNTKAPKK